MGFLNKRHCEKTSFVIAGGIGVLFFILVFGFNPVINFQGLSQSLLTLVIFIVALGYIGVIYYRIVNHKKPIFILQFWKAT